MCENCGKEIVTFVKHEYNIYVWPLLLGLFYIYGFKYGLILSFVFVPLCQNVMHYCPDCEDVLFKIAFFPIQNKNSVKA